MATRQLTLLVQALTTTCLLLALGFWPEQANAHHWPSSCGGKNQKPCTVLQHIPSCKPNLVEKPLGKKCVSPPPRTALIPRPKNCGGLGQKPCPLPHIPSCNGNLVEHFIKGQCIRSDGDIVNMAKNLVRESSSLLSAATRSIASCGIDALIRSQPNKGALAQQIQNSACLAHLKQNARQLGYNTMTVGGSGGVAFVVGAEGENGFAFDLNGRNPVATYHTLGIKFLSIGAGAAVTVGFFKKDNLSFGGDAHGAVVGFSAGGGSGGAAWFEYNGQVAGINAIVTAGAEAELGYVRNTTEVVPIRLGGGSGGGSQVAGPYPEESDGGYGPEEPGGGYYEPEPPMTDFERNQKNARELGTEIGLAIRARREARAKRTEMKICNKTKHKKIYLSYAYWREASVGGEAGWFMKGWWHIKRKRCQDRLFLPDGPNGVGGNYRVQLIATAGPRNKETGARRAFAGEGIPLCINGVKPYEYSNATTRLCSGKDDRFVRGIEFEVGMGKNVYTFRD